MGLRFRKSFKIMPGVRVNLGRRGASISVGRKGARMTYSPSSGKVTGTLGIPGTGLSFSEEMKLGGVREEIRPSGFTSPEPEKRTEDVRKDLRSLYKKGDDAIDWTQVALRSDYMKELKPYLGGIFTKDIDTYISLFEKYDILEELTDIISNIEVGMNSGDSLSVNYDFDGEMWFPSRERTSEESHSSNILYALSCIDIKIARDAFALLPVSSIIVDSRVGGAFVYSVEFTREKFLSLNFSRQDAFKIVDAFKTRFHLDGEHMLAPITTFDGD